jgi:hypothetical protein
VAGASLLLASRGCAAETMLANAMNEMRAWLDTHRVKPVEFKIAMTGMPGIVFDIRLRREE